MIDVAAPPYRVEWRPNLTTRWVLVKLCATRQEADTRAVEALAEFGGYCRLLTQHVIASSQRPGEWEVAP